MSEFPAAIPVTTPPTAAKPASVLLVEDDTNLRLVTRLACEAAGFMVREAPTGAAALAAASASRPDVVLLDLTLPDIDGYDVCRALRRQDAQLPIIMVTARGEETDKVVGLELGADDYLTKPFGTRELVARIRAQLRRLQASQSAPPTTGEGAVTPAGDGALIQLGELRLSVDEREVTVAGTPLRLTRTEFDLLAYLARHVGRALARSQIVGAIWGYDSDGDDRLVDSHIKNLRKKLEPFGSRAPEIATVPQIGYKLLRPAPAA